MTLDLFFFIFRQMLFVSIPILIVSIGGLFSERSGVINIALEGIMIFGSFFGIITLHYLEPFLSGQVLFLVAMLVTALSGVVIASIHAFAAINMNADQTISGTAINIFAPAVTVFLARLIYSVKEIPFKNQFVIAKVPLLGDIPIIGPMFFTGNLVYVFVQLGKTLTHLMRRVLALSAFVGSQSYCLVYLGLWVDSLLPFLSLLHLQELLMVTDSWLLPS